MANYEKGTFWNEIKISIPMKSKDITINTN